MADLTLSITIPEASISRVIDGYSYGNGYQDLVEDFQGNVSSNPISKATFAKTKLREHIKKVIKEYENKVDNESSNATNESEISAINITVT